MLHSRPKRVNAEDDNGSDLGLGVLPSTTDLADDPVDINEARFSEILGCIEELIEDHMSFTRRGCPELSRLSHLVPTIGAFFTKLPLREAFVIQNKKRSIAKRMFVPPSFNDVRFLLNSAQVISIAGKVKTLTFDGDQTLYDDGKDFGHDSALVDILIKLLEKNVAVAVVTAAGYPNEPLKYEKRLTGLLHKFKDSKLTPAQLSRFYVLGGECNYLFSYDSEIGHLVSVPETAYNPPEWSTAAYASAINEILDVAERHLRKRVKDLDLAGSCMLLRKSRAVGVIPAAGAQLSREQLDELCLSVQKKVSSYQDIKALNPSEEPYIHIPFCAFNGGSDAWFDIGNKLIGVKILQDLLGCGGDETLHFGDQFLSTGNDVATRGVCCTAWITSPRETEEVLAELLPLLGRAL